MKLVKALSEDFHFPYDATLAFDITTEGTLVPDYVAESMVDRFHVSIADAGTTETTTAPAPVQDTTNATPGSANLATLQALDVEALRGLAAEKGIALGNLKAKPKIIEAIAKGLEAQAIAPAEPIAPVAPETEVTAPVVEATEPQAPVVAPEPTVTTP